MPKRPSSWWPLWLALLAGTAQAQPVPDAAPPGAEAAEVIPTGASADADSALLPGVRFTLQQELAARIRAPHSMANNRSSLRVEVEKHFLDSFFVRLDAAETQYWHKDHRALGRGEAFSEATVRDAYLQFSQGSTSVKLGRQIVVWGESDAGVITDVISPRNLSELFFISLEASRISQTMLTLDQFTPFGDWSLFYVPNARFNQLPERGTAYDVDPFGGAAVMQTEERRRQEGGLRWKKTFGNTDLGLMAASLVDNDYAVHQAGTLPDGRLLIANEGQRLHMLGATVSHVTGSLLFSGEVARKSPRAYLDGGTLQKVGKDALDTSLRVEYSIGNGGNHAVSLEAVNKRVLGWQASLLPTARNTNSWVLGWRDTFFNENLSVNWLTVFNQTYPSFQHSLFLAYRLNSRVNLTLDSFWLSVRDRNNDLYAYRGQNAAVFRINYQF